MKSYNYWRNKQLYKEIAVTTNRNFIARGAPTLPSIQDDIFRNSKVQPDIMTMHDEIGNGDNDEPQEFKNFPNRNSDHGDDTAPSMESGGIIDGPNGSVDDIIDAVKDLSTRNNWSLKYTIQLFKEKLKQRLGPSGMDKLKDWWHDDDNMQNEKENFNTPPLGDMGTKELKFSEPVGQTPVLSQGVPVSPTLKYESFQSYIDEQGGDEQQMMMQQIMQQQQQKPDTDAVRNQLQISKIDPNTTNDIVNALSIEDVKQRAEQLKKISTSWAEKNQAVMNTIQQHSPQQ